MNENWKIARIIRDNTGIEMTGDEVQKEKEKAYFKIWFELKRKGFLLPYPNEEPNHFESILKCWFNEEKISLVKKTSSNGKNRIAHPDYV